MANLQKYNAKLCLTAAGVLIHDSKVLLVKHKKLGLWLAPGGHVEENELPHVAAEREFWEEAGVKVKAVSVANELPSNDSEYVPNPFLTNLHWISKENYENRLQSKDKEKRQSTEKWQRGCEQHYCFIFMMKPVNDVNFKQNTEETDGIGWFAEEEINDLETTPDIKVELQHAFTLLKSK
jgi:8-oxo-dGTP pyrophosphatase MutT (NUDIX family)